MINLFGQLTSMHPDKNCRTLGDNKIYDMCPKYMGYVGLGHCPKNKYVLQALAVTISNLDWNQKVEYLVDEEYIDKAGQGDLAAMTPTIVDMLGVFFLKVVIMMNLSQGCNNDVHDGFAHDLHHSSRWELKIKAIFLDLDGSFRDEYLQCRHPLMSSWQRALVRAAPLTGPNQ